jgi:diadenosine tetraphosphate (Ap4A) HIT family hydrolase
MEASGAAWRDAARWEELKAANSCPICVDGEPRHVIADLDVTWVTAAPKAPLPGYACVVAKRHVVEPFELPPNEVALFWDEAMAVARALHRLLQPPKLNYEIHGNTLPHLHLHVFPRFADDPYVGGPIDPRRASFTRTSEELDAMRRALAATFEP